MRVPSRAAWWASFDGDTITVLDRTKVQHKIRLSGIDAPKKGQAGGALL